MAAKTIKALKVPGLVYPKKSCAAVLSHFLREAGIDVPVTTGAQNLADRLRVNRKWKRIDVGKQQPGDVGVCYSISDDVAGADHIYLVVERKGSDLTVIADNQAQGKTHTRYASGKGEKRPPNISYGHLSELILKKTWLPRTRKRSGLTRRRTTCQSPLWTTVPRASWMRTVPRR